MFKRVTISPQICELRNINNVAYLIVIQSMAAKENKGAFFSLDLV
jgi:L-aspartate oxidase